jgi:hypothetical protein
VNLIKQIGMTLISREEISVKEENFTEFKFNTFPVAGAENRIKIKTERHLF